MILLFFCLRRTLLHCVIAVRSEPSLSLCLFSLKNCFVTFTLCMQGTGECNYFKEVMRTMQWWFFMSQFFREDLKARGLAWISLFHFHLPTEIPDLALTQIQISWGNELIWRFNEKIWTKTYKKLWEHRESKDNKNIKNQQNHKKHNWSGSNIAG